jgi:hypothetical protein
LVEAEQAVKIRRAAFGAGGPISGCRTILDFA